MTQTGPVLPASRREAWKLGVALLVRVLLTVSALVAAYFLIPTRSSGAGSDLPWLILDLVVFGLIVAVRVPAIVKSKYPVVRAVETLALLVTVYLLIFARSYLSNSLSDPSGFSQPLDNVTALYFTVTVFATVGFGDIVARNEFMQLLVTVQMLLNLAVLGLLIRLITSAARRGIASRGGQPELGERDRPPF